MEMIVFLRTVTTPPRLVVAFVGKANAIRPNDDVGKKMTYPPAPRLRRATTTRHDDEDEVEDIDDNNDGTDVAVGIIDDNAAKSEANVIPFPTAVAKAEATLFGRS